MKKIILPFLLLFNLASTAQVNLDSLWQVWQDESQADTSRLKAIRQISFDGYLFNQPDSAFYFAELQYEFAKATKDSLYMGNARNIQGISFHIQGNYTKAMAYYLESIEIGKAVGDQLGIASSFGNLGNIYEIQGNHSIALNYYSNSLEIREEFDDQSGIAASLNNIGNIYENQGNHAKAIEYYLRCLKIDEEAGNKAGIATSLSNIGTNFFHQKDYAKAIHYHSRSLKIDQEIGNKFGIAGSLENLGSILLHQEHFEEAMDYFSQSLEIKEEIGDKKGIARSLNNIGKIYLKMGNYPKAIDFSSRSLAIAQELGILYQSKNAAESLWESYKAQGDYKSAIKMLELYIESRDSIFNQENQKELIRLEFKYQYEKQAIADSIKTAEANKIKDARLNAEIAKTKQQKQQKNFLYVGLALALIFGGFIFNRFRVTNQQKGIIEAQKHEVEQQKEQVEEAHKEITDSIAYAKRIQKAILPPTKLVKQYLEHSFILYKPKDVVAGDFYWMEPKGDTIFFAAADCTGHGVPGAMVSVICVNGLNRSVREFGLTEPGKILDNTRSLVIKEFEKSEEDVQDGMDIALCALNGNMLKYAGANNPLWIVRNGKILETKADKQPIGKHAIETPFVSHTIELQKGDSIYIFSDGYADQFGGERNKKFKVNALRKLLLHVQDKSMEEQHKFIDETFENWRGANEQIDDVVLIGVRV